MGYIYVTEKRKIKQKYINYGGVYMHIFKKIFTILAIIFGSLGLMNIVSTDVALPLMYFFMGLTLLTTAKEFYDKNKKERCHNLDSSCNFGLYSYDSQSICLILIK